MSDVRERLKGRRSRKLAFGVEPAERAYRLRLARYEGLGRAVGEHLNGLGSVRPDGSAPAILDVGVGRGRSRRYIEKHGGSMPLRYFGLDLSPRRLDSVYRADEWQLVKANAEAGIPFSSEAFDCVLCEQVLEHLTRPQVVVAEIARVLRPGGVAVVGVPTFPPVLRWVRSRVVPVLDRWRGISRGHVQVFSLGSFRRLIEENGMLDVRAARGFRVLSGGPFAPLEDYRWWWRFNGWLGRVAPWLCAETQIVAVKHGPPQAAQTR